MADWFFHGFVLKIFFCFYESYTNYLQTVYNMQTNKAEVNWDKQTGRNL